MFASRPTPFASTPPSGANRRPARTPCVAGRLLHSSLAVVTAAPQPVSRDVAARAFSFVSGLKFMGKNFAQSALLILLNRRKQALRSAIS